jgi:pimeloyl-ACP methyl ester carboxylesterase
MGGSAALVGPDGPVPADALVLQAVFSDLRQAVFSRVALVFGPWLAPLIEPFLSFQSRLRFGQWPSRIAPLAALRDVTCPVLIIGGARDPFVPLKILDAFHHTAADSRGVWIAPDLGHNGIANTLSEAYRDRVLAFLQECFGP